MADFSKDAADAFSKEFYDEYHKDYEEVRLDYIDLLEVNCKENVVDPTNPEPGPVDPAVDGPQEPNPDPSGYVYEAMWTNRIPDVTVTAYTRNAAGETVLWDAEPYGQRNPSRTDEQGYYEWYVPEGDWKVTYEKDGYVSSESEWMVVPPPQTEVHHNLVSLQAPQVLYAAHYGDEIEIAFTRPVRTETVNSASVSVGTDFTVQAVRPERYGDTDITLASVFLLRPKGSLPDTVRVAVSGGVLSYADVPCGETSLECTRMVRLQSITVPSSAEAQTGVPFTLTVQAQGGDFGRYTLEVAGAHADLLRIDRVSPFDEKGTAVIELTPLASGIVLLDLRIPNTDLTAAVKITSTD